MNLLLDSHAFLWWLQDSRRLSREARRAIAAPASQVFVSAVSIWEIAIKLSVGKLRWREGVTLDDSIASCGFTELPVSVRHAAGVRNLPRHHADPFDRLLVSQALVEDLWVVTADEMFARYGIRTLAAET
jgi:PIN domain nuclease of toxin-antitoxin system